MAKESSLEEVWQTLYNSDNRDMQKLADELDPNRSLSEMFRSVITTENSDNILKFSSTLRKYTGPKDEFKDREAKLEALRELRYLGF